MSYFIFLLYRFILYIQFLSIYFDFSILFLMHVVKIVLKITCLTSHCNPSINQHIYICIFFKDSLISVSKYLYKGFSCGKLHNIQVWKFF